ncbi:MAG: phospholipase D-like domain-containing protein [Candidatus Sericytochromatia bacterium]
MFNKKKTLASLIVLVSLISSGCETINNVPNINAGMTAQSISSTDGKVPDNGDVNIKLDNKILARRTFNNADPIMHIDGAEAYPAIEKLIDQAQKSLYIETFIFHDDATGRRIADKIVAKHKQGVEIKLLVDALGIAIKNDPFYPVVQHKREDDFSAPLQLLAKHIRFNDPMTLQEMEFSSHFELTL